jgi:hypothetical protein
MGAQPLTTIPGKPHIDGTRLRRMWGQLADGLMADGKRAGRLEVVPSLRPPAG